MGWEDAPLLRNNEGHVVPQHWNPDTDSWEVPTVTQKTELTGSNVGFYPDVQTVEGEVNVGNIPDTPKIVDSFGGSSNTTKTYGTSKRGFAIINNGEESLTFTINSLTIPVPADSEFDGEFEEFTSVIVTTNQPFHAIVRG